MSVKPTPHEEVSPYPKKTYPTFFQVPNILHDSGWQSELRSGVQY